MTNIHMINELNNNSLFPAKGKKTQLPDSVVNTKTDIGRAAGLYKNDDGYRPYTIYSGEFRVSLRRTIVKHIRKSSRYTSITFFYSVVSSLFASSNFVFEKSQHYFICII